MIKYFKVFQRHSLVLSLSLSLSRSPSLSVFKSDSLSKCYLKVAYLSLSLALSVCLSLSLSLSRSLSLFVFNSDLFSKCYLKVAYSWNFWLWLFNVYWYIHAIFGHFEIIGPCKGLHFIIWGWKIKSIWIIFQSISYQMQPMVLTSNDFKGQKLVFRLCIDIEPQLHLFFLKMAPACLSTYGNSEEKNCLHYL